MLFKVSRTSQRPLISNEKKEIEINTLEELIDFIKNTEVQQAILNTDIEAPAIDLEIYDDYRE